MTALQQFGAEMLKLSRGLESVASSSTASPTKSELSTAHLLPFSHMSVQKQNSAQQYPYSHPHQQLQMQHHHQHLHHQLQTHMTANQQQLSISPQSLQHPDQQQELNLLDQQKFKKNHEYQRTKSYYPAINFSQDFKPRKR